MQKNDLGPEAVLDKVAVDEPSFVLRAKDKYAPTLVWLWSVMYALEYQDKDVVARAQDIFVKMLAYQSEHGIPVAGIGQSALAALCELIKVANFRVSNAPVEMSNDDKFRMFLCQTKLEVEDPEKG